MLLPWHIYQEAEEEGVQVHFLPFEEQPALSVPGHIGIDLTKVQTMEEETTIALHEFAHCATHSFYNAYSPIDCRQKQENTADKYAILRYLPKHELECAASQGYRELWSLAEYFGVTEEFMKKAVCYYTNGNLAVDLYF